MIEKATDFVQILLARKVSPGDFVVDATCGKGNDTLFLSGLVGSTGRVLALDIQEEAIRETKTRLREADKSNAVLLKRNHAELESILEERGDTPPRLVLFNLGYMPGGDKSVTTEAHTTVSAVGQAISCIRPDGVLILVVYPGHPAGSVESEALGEWIRTLDPKLFSVSKHQWLNLRNSPPYVIVIEGR